ncbi:hypothetical protein Syun_003986 [Stephania yunnanensis]|uniref:Uncharacterized protein n=1 Tax=Stephania yunnanensis TaxID=152371 RepID=A0AAP0L5D7_9MAGN
MHPISEWPHSHPLGLSRLSLLSKSFSNVSSQASSSQVQTQKANSRKRMHHQWLLLRSLP